MTLKSFRLIRSVGASAEPGQRRLEAAEPLKRVRSVQVQLATPEVEGLAGADSFSLVVELKASRGGSEAEHTRRQSQHHRAGSIDLDGRVGNRAVHIDDPIVVHGRLNRNGLRQDRIAEQDDA